MTDSAALAAHAAIPIADPAQPARLRRVLLVAYHFPPEPAAGSLRPSYLARYLPQFGWEATVLTKRGNGSDNSTSAAMLTAGDLFERYMRAPNKASAGELNASEGTPTNSAHGARSAVRDFVKSVLFFPDRASGWIPGAIATGLDATRREHFDAVLSTGPPQSAHLVAYAVARMRHLAWIADFRDLWYANPYAATKGKTRTAIERWLEAVLRRRASAITAVHADLINQQERVYGRSFSEVIPAAYDPAEWEALDDPEAIGFRLCYAGTLYEGRRRFDILLDAIATLRALSHPAGLAARIDYYGPESALAKTLAAERGLGDVVECHGNVAHGDVLPALRRAAVLLVLLDMRPETVPQLGSKIFEYIGARRPVLAIGPAGSAVQSFIAQHHIGWFATDEIEAQAALRAAYKAVTSGAARRMSAGIGKGIPTARDVASRFAALLDVVAGSGRRPTLYRPS
ncbi:MAG: glycosyltransferase [Candidatus Eremiobacteraeota bacterium]|nr:glycosyltransferase [Candidatus Eremiobacteraeota bacterium]MBV8366674.1 glycosyltransferase [Candidatus Eremiobacteraeota bacterium]